MFTINSKGISLVQNYAYMFKQDQLKTLKEQYKDKDNFHIYMIGKRPLIMFDKSSYDISGSTFKGNIRIAHEGTFKNVSIQIPMEEMIVRVSFEMNDQHIIIETLTKQAFKAHAALLLQTLLAQSEMDSSIIDLQVLYIGRAFGLKETPTRNVFDRLQHHETVQKIYSERSWDTDVWLTAWKFSQNSIAFFDPNESNDDLKNYIHNLVESKKNNTSFLQISNKQNIAVAEAALINYFKPMYNDKFKNNFPSSDHEYRECYELGLDYVMVELDTSGLGFRLWSEEAEVNKEHIIKYTFNSEQDFKNMFSFDQPK